LRIETLREDIQPKYAPDLFGKGVPTYPKKPQDYIEAAMDNTRANYTEGAPCMTDVVDNPIPADLDQTQRIYRHIMAEGYGDDPNK
jgi:hypothetical protein